MVFHKKFNRGSIGYIAPTMPHVPKSAKGRRSIRKKHDDKQLCAFDLLATVAGQLLSELENPHFNLNGNIKKENQYKNMSFKSEDYDKGSCNESTLHAEFVYKRQVNSYTLNELTTKSSDKKIAKLNASVKNETILEVLNDAMDLDVKPSSLISSDSSVEKPVSKASSFPNIRDGNQLIVDKDDDENSSGCTHPNNNSITGKKSKTEHAGDHRVSKLLASKFWKGAPNAKVDGENSKYDVYVKPAFRSRKMCYTRQRTQRSSFKSRKLHEHRLINTSSGGIEIEANGALDQKSIHESGECHVKFSIKSFKVPELFIEIPETATIGSLKRTVTEAVTSILARGLKVGVVYEGKKVRDDKQTLFEAGIYHDNKIENLGFALEPNSTHIRPPLPCPEDPKFILSADPFLPCAPVEPIQRIPAIIPTVDQVHTPDTLIERVPALNLNSHESDHDSVHSSSVEKAEYSKAMIPLPDMTADPLAKTPLRKSRRSELAQRRIRRPFSVAEVEALVHAVEKLGTGRWRDVKIRAFDNAKHRTYVDLKDKWKTLVHTATISPQQRRGEPVPQELLDRVLSAQNYWSQQQAKLQIKSSQAESYLPA